MCVCVFEFVWLCVCVWRLSLHTCVYMYCTICIYTCVYLICVCHTDTRTRAAQLILHIVCTRAGQHGRLAREAQHRVLSVRNLRPGEEYTHVYLHGALRVVCGPLHEACAHRKATGTQTNHIYVPLQTREHAWAGMSGMLHFGGARGAFTSRGAEP